MIWRWCIEYIYYKIKAERERESVKDITAAK
jgi:hypothetical protein